MLSQNSTVHSIHVPKVLDARPKGMFDGTVPDPNPKLHSGHILGSINFPFTDVIDSQSKTLKDADSLKKGKKYHIQVVMIKLNQMNHACMIVLVSQY